MTNKKNGYLNNKLPKVAKMVTFLIINSFCAQGISEIVHQVAHNADWGEGGATIGSFKAKIRETNPINRSNIPNQGRLS